MPQHSFQLVSYGYTLLKRLSRLLHAPPFHSLVPLTEPRELQVSPPIACPNMPVGGLGVWIMYSAA